MGVKLREREDYVRKTIECVNVFWAVAMCVLPCYG